MFICPVRKSRNRITYTLKWSAFRRPLKVLTLQSADRHSGTLSRAHRKPKAAASQTDKRRQASRQRKVGDKNIWKIFLCGKAKRANRQGYHLFVRQCKRQRVRERRHSRLPAVANPLFLTRLHRSHEATANVGTPGTLHGRFASLFSIPRGPTGQDACQSFSL